MKRVLLALAAVATLLTSGAAQMPPIPTLGVDFTIVPDDYRADLNPAQYESYREVLGKEIASRIYRYTFLLPPPTGQPGDYVLTIRLIRKSTPSDKIAPTFLEFTLTSPLFAEFRKPRVLEWPFRNEEDTDAAVSKEIIRDQVLAKIDDLVKNKLDQLVAPCLSAISLEPRMAYRIHNPKVDVFYCALPFSYDRLRSLHATEFLLMTEVDSVFGSQTLWHRLRSITAKLDRAKVGIDEEDFENGIVAQELGADSVVDAVEASFEASDPVHHPDPLGAHGEDKADGYLKTSGIFVTHFIPDLTAPSTPWDLQ